jgi:hypothetical protein
MSNDFFNLPWNSFPDTLSVAAGSECWVLCERADRLEQSKVPREAKVRITRWKFVC